jgi:hypothetical protein
MGHVFTPTKATDYDFLDKNFKNAFDNQTIPIKKLGQTQVLIYS